MHTDEFFSDFVALAEKLRDLAVPSLDEPVKQEAIQELKSMAGMLNYYIRYFEGRE